MPAPAAECGCGLSGVRFPAAPYAYPANTLGIGAIPAALVTPAVAIAAVFALAFFGGKR